MTSVLDVEAFSTSLDWKQFESFAKYAFESFGFQTVKNFRIPKPRMEIDLLAISNKVTFAIDCKHWKRTAGHDAMLALAERQIKRCKELVRRGQIRNVIPVLLTWRDEQLTILENGVAVVPIHKISDFILNWDSANEIRIIRKRSRAARNQISATL
jgi:Holliday junction resolvase-like predicted endonuclease